MLPDYCDLYNNSHSSSSNFSRNETRQRKQRFQEVIQKLVLLLVSVEACSLKVYVYFWNPAYKYLLSVVSLYQVYHGWKIQGSGKWWVHCAASLNSKRKDHLTPEAFCGSEDVTQIECPYIQKANLLISKKIFLEYFLFPLAVSNPF